MGRALEPEEEQRILAAADSKLRWRWAAFVIRTLLMTGMRVGELLNATWNQVDMRRGLFRVGRAKTVTGTGRQIPMTAELLSLFSAYRALYERRFGPFHAEWYILPAGKPQPHDPRRPCASIESSWRAIRKAARVKCRLHDLRHTACSKMGEAGVPDATIMALMGHLSEAMLRRYSHSRRASARQAVEALSLGESQVYGHVTKSPKIRRLAAVG
ncbi:MAG: site-specific integrase [Bryobacteraceae bacterium]